MFHMSLLLQLDLLVGLVCQLSEKYHINFIFILAAILMCLSASLNRDRHEARINTGDKHSDGFAVGILKYKVYLSQKTRQLFFFGEKTGEEEVNYDGLASPDLYGEVAILVCGFML